MANRIVTPNTNESLYHIHIISTTLHTIMRTAPRAQTKQSCLSSLEGVHQLPCLAVSTARDEPCRDHEACVDDHDRKCTSKGRVNIWVSYRERGADDFSCIICTTCGNVALDYVGMYVSSRILWSSQDISMA